MAEWVAFRDDDWLGTYPYRKGVELVPPNDTALADFPVLIRLDADPDLATNVTPAEPKPK
jgi:hypothetical protein